MRGQEQVPNQTHHPFREMLVAKLQRAYTDRRSIVTNGTPQVSKHFFETWRNAPSWQGLVKATGYLIKRENELGKPDANPVLKAAANLTASAFLAAGGELWAKETQHKTNIQPVRRAARVALNLTYGMLFYAQGEGGGGESAVSGGGESNTDTPSTEGYWMQEYRNSLKKRDEVMNNAMQLYKQGNKREGEALMQQAVILGEVVEHYRVQTMREAGMNEREINNTIQAFNKLTDELAKKVSELRLDENGDIRNADGSIYNQNFEEWKLNHPDE